MATDLMSKINFLKGDLAKELDKLTAETKPEYGQMTAQHMVEHLGMVFVLSTKPNELGKELGDEKRAEFKQTIIIEDKPIPKGLKAVGVDGLLPLRFENMEEAKAKLLQSVARFFAFFSTQPSVTINHPKLGVLNFQEWTAFHAKHCKYHLAQFGIK